MAMKREWGKSKAQQRAIDQRMDNIDANAKKEQMRINHQKNNLKRQTDQHIFDEVKVKKNYGPVKYRKEGLKIAPIITLSLWFISFSYRTLKVSMSRPALFDSAVLTVWKLSFILKKWTTRGEVKPKGAVGSYLIVIRKV